ncbi:hypothetical protein [Amycolatopsis sp. WGS_07]|uniref:hypothetical protein n=1 Tax=Amycolatopsis sp. WGS_07 TaxID=3076764 RepID=UPI003873AEDA
MTHANDEPEAMLVEEYSSCLRRTEIHLLPDGAFQWTHRPGTDSPVRMAAPDRALAQAIAACSVPALRWVPASADDAGALTYLASSPLSAMSWLDLEQPRTQQLLATTLEGTGRALRALHQLRGPDVASTPSGPRRVARWLDEPGLGPASLAKLADLARPRWGRARLSRLRGWCVTPKQERVLLHGFASLGTLLPPLAIPETDTPQGEFLIGSDLAAGRPESDLGWLLGELHELHWVGVHPWMDFPALSQALRRGYGPGCDEAALGRSAVLRLITHMHDYAAYAGWLDEFTGYVDFAAELIDDEGRRAARGEAA